jgi:hypothetical protein
MQSKKKVLETNFVFNVSLLYLHYKIITKQTEQTKYSTFHKLNRLPIGDLHINKILGNGLKLRLYYLNLQQTTKKQQVTKYNER